MAEVNISKELYGKIAGYFPYDPSISLGKINNPLDGLSLGKGSER